MDGILWSAPRGGWHTVVSAEGWMAYCGQRRGVDDILWSALRGGWHTVVSAEGFLADAEPSLREMRAGEWESR